LEVGGQLVELQDRLGQPLNFLMEAMILGHQVLLPLLELGNREARSLQLSRQIFVNR